MSKAYYNEFDKFAAAWLRELIKEKLIAEGDVDERDIRDVTPKDLDGYTQCHFFAGIGGWSYALRLAGWPDSRPVWTGSCPCQPFSAAGKREGFADERHLWPAFFHLIRVARPLAVFGEQVDAAMRHGWLDLVQTDLEGEGYRVGVVGSPAAGFGAPHIRQRLYFVAHRSATRLEGAAGPSIQGRGAGFAINGVDGLLAESQRLRPQRESFIGCGGVLGTMDEPREPREPVGAHGASLGLVANPQYDEHGGENGNATKSCSNGQDGGLPVGSRSGLCGELGDSIDQGPQGHRRFINLNDPQGRQASGRYGSTSGFLAFWSNAEWLWCRDQKYRPVEPTIFPLANGIPNRVGQLRGAGNAIVPQQAVAFIQAYLDIVQ